MPTDLPPDYRPRPASDPGPQPANDPGGVPPAPGTDAPAFPGETPQPGPAVGVPGAGPDVIDPVGWPEPPTGPAGVPSPAGVPAF